MSDLLPIASIRRDGGTQPRAALNLHWVEEYGQDMIAGASFPPVVVFYDGQVHWLADGFHRTEAALAVGLSEIQAEVHQGTVRDAILYSVGANGNHGQRRTNDDKRRAVKTLLSDPEWARWSDREIARKCGVSDPFVGKLRPVNVPVSANGLQIPQPQGRLVSRGGTTYTQKPRADAGGAKGQPAVPHQPATPMPSEHKRHAADRADGGGVAPPHLSPTLGGNETLPSSRGQVHGPTNNNQDVQDAGTLVAADVEPFDSAAADLRVSAMTAIGTLALLPSPREVMDAANKHFGHGVLPEVVKKASAWLHEFALLYSVEEPVRAQAVRDAVAEMGNAA